MTKWTNDDDEIFETEDEARDRCYDMITEDDIVEVIKDSYIESYWKLFMDALFAHDVWEYQKLQDEILDKVWEDCGSTDINLDSVEDSFFESSSCQVIWNAHCNICNRQFFQYDNFILSSSYAEKKED